MNTEAFILDHPCGVTISADLTESSLIEFERRDIGTGYVWYDIPATDIRGSLLAISLCFHRGRIDSLRIGVMPESDSDTGWQNWSESVERQRAADIESWLTSLGYPTGHFDWGEIWAGYDAKSASGHGGVRYKS